MKKNYKRLKKKKHPELVEGRFFKCRVSGQDSNEKKGQEESDKGATDNLANSVTNPFFEAGEIILVEIELIDEHIQVSPLVSEIHAYAGSVINNDKGQDGRKGERPGMNTFEVGDAGQKGDDETGMSTGHMPMGKSVFDIKSVFVSIKNKLDELSEYPNCDRDEKDQVGLYKFHRNKG